MLLRSLIILFLITSAFAFENSFGTKGYFRIQTVLDDEKSDVCFKAVGAKTKYRLGNECDSYLMLGLYQDIVLDNGIRIHNQIRPIFTSPNHKKMEYIRLDELYSEVYNIFDDNSASIWFGRRFYKRYDSFLSDFFFFTISGDGFGINNIDLGEFDLSYSFLFNDIDPTVVIGDERILFQSHDIRLEKDVDRGDFTVLFHYMLLDSKNFNTTQKLEKSDGYTVGAVYKDKKITNELFGMNGKNITGLFYGSGLARGAAKGSPYLQEPLIDDMLSSGKNVNDSKTLRFINYNGFDNDSIGFISNFVYEYTDNKKYEDILQNWYSFGVRPYLFLNKNFRISTEFGYDFVDDKVQNKKYTLSKFSGAFEYALKKGIWEMPVLRVYYTHATWNKNSAGMVGSSYYKDKTQGDTAGIQFEYWW